MAKINEKALNKGHMRKLTALRKSLGPKIADKAFGGWLSQQKSSAGSSEDKNAAMIEAAIAKLIKTKGLRIPQRGYKITRGRGKVKVAPVTAPAKPRKPKKAKVASKENTLTKAPAKRSAPKRKGGGKAKI